MVQMIKGIAIWASPARYELVSLSAYTISKLAEVHITSSIIIVELDYYTLLYMNDIYYRCVYALYFDKKDGS